jgi:DNA modification methylase
MTNPADKIEHWAIDKLIPYARNSRTHSDGQIDQIAASIREWGWTTPVLVDKEGNIIAGHGRVLAAKKLDIATIPVVIADGWSDAKKRAYIIADNKLALNAGWDNELLALEFKELEELGFDLELTGFSLDELADLMEEEIEEGLTDEDSVPGIPDDPITVNGDVWLLGTHRLMCGDSTIIDQVDKLLNGCKPNLMVTDPPYGVNYEAGWRADAKGRKKTKREETSNLANDDRADWYDAWVLFPGDVAYVWHASAFTDVVMDSLRRANFDVKQQIIWNKNVHALSRSNYHWKHEPCWYAVRKGGDASWLAGRDQMTVWDVPSVIFEKDKTSHPTQKSVGIYERPILNHTRQGDTLYEPFGGSGTQIIACEKHRRVSFTMELDPKFCDVIVNRWQDFSGKQAIHAETDQPFGS